MNAPSAFGPYRVFHQTGSGVQGPVFRAFDLDQDHLVTVKVFTAPLTPDRVVQVADALRDLVRRLSPAPAGLVPLVDAGIEGTEPFLVMACQADETLDVLLRRTRPLPVDSAVRVVAGVATALAAAGRAGLGHGRLHPRDVFVSDDAVGITGVGIAEAFARAHVHLPVPRFYAAPERRRAGAAWDARADVYALAAMAHEMLTGVRPAAAGEQDGVFPASTTPEQRVQLRRVLARGLAERPEDRYPDAAAFAADFTAAAEGRPVGEPAAVSTGDAGEERVSGSDELDPDATVMMVVPPSAAEALRHQSEPAASARAGAVVPSSLQVPPETPSHAPDVTTVVSAASSSASPATSAPGMEPPDVVVTETAPAAPLATAGPAPATAHATAGPGVDGDHDAKLDLMRPARVAPPAAVRHAPRAPHRGLAGLAAIGLFGLVAGSAGAYWVVSRLPAEPVSVAGQLATDVPVSPDAAPPSGTSSSAAASSAAPSPDDPSPSNAASAADSQAAAGAPPASAAPSDDGRDTAAADAVPAIADRATDAAADAVRARLVVRSDPSGALVTVDGRLSGTTPAVVRDLPAGTHRVRVARPGHVPYETRVTIDAATTERTLSVSLAPGLEPGAATAGTLGTVDVDSRPRGAIVRVDGRPIGRAPLRVLALAPGPHEIALELGGYTPVTRRVDVTAGRTASLNVTLKSLTP